MSKDEFARTVAHRKQAAITALFDHLFLLKHKRLPSYWEARLGEALVNGELKVQRKPKELSLCQVHEVAAEVADALTTSEAVMVSD
jgi:hypothetical protein